MLSCQVAKQHRIPYFRLHRPATNNPTTTRDKPKTNLILCSLVKLTHNAIIALRFFPFIHLARLARSITISSQGSGDEVYMKEEKGRWREKRGGQRCLFGGILYLPKRAQGHARRVVIHRGTSLRRLALVAVWRCCTSSDGPMPLPLRHSCGRERHRNSPD